MRFRTAWSASRNGSSMGQSLFVLTTRGLAHLGRP
jgi:hypothetical protein